MQVKHVYVNPEFLPDNSFDIDQCLRMYNRHKGGFFRKDHPDDEFSEAQCRLFAECLASYLVWQCFAYGNTYDHTMLITLPWYHKVSWNTLTMYWNKAYDYGNAFMTQGRVWTRPLPIVGTVDDIVAYLH